MSFPGVIPPPPGVEADVDHPQDVLRTVNYVTQALTLFFSTIFVGLRFYTKRNIYRGPWTSDDCEHHNSSFTKPWMLTTAQMLHLLLMYGFTARRLVKKFEADKYLGINARLLYIRNSR